MFVVPLLYAKVNQYLLNNEPIQYDDDTFGQLYLNKSINYEVIAMWEDTKKQIAKFNPLPSTSYKYFSNYDINI